MADFDLFCGLKWHFGGQNCRNLLSQACQNNQSQGKAKAGGSKYAIACIAVLLP